MVCLGNIWTLVTREVTSPGPWRAVTWGMFLLCYGIFLATPKEPRPANRSRSLVVPAVNAHKGRRRPKTDWECFPLDLRPAGFQGGFKRIWAITSASTISIMSAELCEALGGKFTGTEAILGDISSNNFKIPMASFELILPVPGFVVADISMGVVENLRKTAGADFIASTGFSQAARAMGMTKRWSELPPKIGQRFITYKKDYETRLNSVASSIVAPVSLNCISYRCL